MVKEWDGPVHAVFFGSDHDVVELEELWWKVPVYHTHKKNDTITLKFNINPKKLERFLYIIVILALVGFIFLRPPGECGPIDDLTTEEKETSAPKERTKWRAFVCYTGATMQQIKAMTTDHWPSRKHHHQNNT